MVDKIYDFINYAYDFLFSIREEIGVFGVLIFLFVIFYVFLLLLGLVFKLKNKFWDEPRNNLKELEVKLKNSNDEIETLKKNINNIPRKSDNLLGRIAELKKQNAKLNEIIDKLLENKEILQFTNDALNEKLIEKESNRRASIEKVLNEFLEVSKSNLTAIPYMSQIMADLETHGIKLLAMQLNWGSSQERMKKVKSLITLRKETKEMLEKYKASEYQLAYLLELYPALQDVIDCEFNQLPITDFTQNSDYDKTRDFLSKEEYQALSTVERNQLALDRYKNSKNKSKWQIGRDYELYVGYKYSLKGYTIDYTGSYMKLEDLGRDLIAKKDGTILIIQCKYWSSSKLIHEKHITQLYGTTVCYCFEHNIPLENVKGVLITNITLSDTAKKMADYLGIQYAENFKKHDFPCIKCNIGHDADGYKTKIYHLPFDQQYDVTKIDEPGEFYAMTVQEAEDAGFRRAFKWHSL